MVSSATSSTKALPTKGLSTPSIPKPVKKAFTPPTRAKKDIGINAGVLHSSLWTVVLSTWRQLCVLDILHLYSPSLSPIAIAGH